MTYEEENNMQFENANEGNEQLTQLQIEKELLEERVLELEEESKKAVQIAKQDAERKKGLAIKNAVNNNSLSKEELIAEAKKQLAEEFDLDSIRKERVQNQVSKNLATLLDAKPEFKGVANLNAVTEYVSATGKTVEETLEVLYGNITPIKNDGVMDSDTTRNNKAANTGDDDDVDKAIKAAAGY